MSNIPAIIIVGIFGILSLFSFYEYESNKILRANNEEYKTEINKLELQAEQQAKNYDAARQDANKQMRHIQDSAKIILATKIPKGCDEAIKWGLNEAHTFA